MSEEKRGEQSGFKNIKIINKKMYYYVILLKETNIHLASRYFYYICTH